MPGKNNTCSYLSGYKHNTITKANSSEDRSIIRHSRHLKPPLVRQNTYVIITKRAILVILSRPLARLYEGSENGKKRLNQLK